MMNFYIALGTFSVLALYLLNRFNAFSRWWPVFRTRYPVAAYIIALGLAAAAMLSYAYVIMNAHLYRVNYYQVFITCLTALAILMWLPSSVIITISRNLGKPDSIRWYSTLATTLLCAATAAATVLANGYMAVL